jgi:hypothetical protein
MDNMEEREVEQWNDLENTGENSENIGKIWSKILKWFGKYGRKASWMVKRYGKYIRKVSRIVQRYGKCGRKVSWTVKR